MRTYFTNLLHTSKKELDTGLSEIDKKEKNGIEIDFGTHHGVGVRQGLKNMIKKDVMNSLDDLEGTEYPTDEEFKQIRNTIEKR